MTYTLFYIKISIVTLFFFLSIESIFILKWNIKKEFYFGLKVFWLRKNCDIKKSNHRLSKYGPTITIQGDDLRKIFKLYDYSKEGRYNNFLKFSRFARFITNQNINVIFTVVGMQKIQRDWLKKNIVNYVEIYIETKISKIKEKNKKKTYKKNQNIVGIHISQNYKKTRYKIVNDFKQSVDVLSKQLFQYIDLIDKKWN